MVRRNLRQVALRNARLLTPLPQRGQRGIAPGVVKRNAPHAAGTTGTWPDPPSNPLSLPKGRATGTVAEQAQNAPLSITDAKALFAGQGRTLAVTALQPSPTARKNAADRAGTAPAWSEDAGTTRNAVPPGPPRFMRETGPRPSRQPVWAAFAQTGREVISGLFRGNVGSAAKCNGMYPV